MNDAMLRFGILGLSEGNGHPYSWSAIFNGYDAAAMAKCPFPVIPAYLARQKFPHDAIADARVTHVWAQDRACAAHIAAAARIPHVVDDPIAMIGAVDAILLARDDAAHHFAHAAPFLEAGLPIFVDKPIALSVAAAQRLYDRQKRAGQIFTCSALAYAAELSLSSDEVAQLGALRFAEAVTIKDWDRYAVHVLEPLHALLAAAGPITEMRATGRNVRHLDIVWASGVEARVTALGVPQGEIAIRLFGEKGWRALTFRDTFAAFRAALAHFTAIVRGRSPPQDPAGVLAVVRLIEAGRNLP